MGTNPTFEIEQLKKALKGVVYSLARNAIASAIIKIGYTYQEEQSYETMKTVIAKGKGISSGIIETGVELGMGMKLAKGFGETINNMSDSFFEKAIELKCINCNMHIDRESKFCKHCGQKQEIQCSECGRVYKEAVKFCNDCGALIGKNEDALNEEV